MCSAYKCCNNTKVYSGLCSYSEFCVEFKDRQFECEQHENCERHRFPSLSLSDERLAKFLKIIDQFSLGGLAED